MMRSRALFFFAAAAFILPVSANAAQSLPQQGLGGNPVPGVCLLSREAVFANAKVGKAASARLQQLTEQAQAEIDAERKPVDAELQSFQAAAQSMKPDERRKKEEALAAKLQAVQVKAQQRSQELELTREKALARISSEAQPVIAQVYNRHNCGLLFERGTVLGGNMANDLTPAVVEALDAKITTLSFDRETLSAGGAPGAR